MTDSTKCDPLAQSCPTVVKTNRGTYLIVGRKLDHTRHREIKDRVGDGEAAVEISAALLEEAVKRDR